MGFLINGTNVRTLSEVQPLNDIRQATGFSSSNFRHQGWTHEDWWGTKMIMNHSGYIYSGDSGVSTRFLRNGSAFFSVSRRGHRPRMTFGARRWDTSVPNTYFVNKFADGEVWVSTIFNSRTGTRIGTAAEDLQFLFIMLIGPGGGGGGGSGTTSGGGGGAGAFAFFCHRLIAGRVQRVFVGAGGDAGARNTNGGGSGNCQFATFTDINNLGTSGVTMMNAMGGGGGRSGGNNGTAGSGGGVLTSTPNSTNIHRLDERTGANGGSRNNAGSGTGALRTTAYTPEGNRLDFGQGSGGTGPSGGGGGGGWFWGHNGGNGGDWSAGGNGGIGAGGGGGAWVIFAGHEGGRGGNGYAALFY